MKKLTFILFFFFYSFYASDSDIGEIIKKYEQFLENSYDIFSEVISFFSQNYDELPSEVKVELSDKKVQLFFSKYITDCLKCHDADSARSETIRQCLDPINGGRLSCQILNNLKKNWGRNNEASGESNSNIIGFVIDNYNQFLIEKLFNTSLKLAEDKLFLILSIEEFNKEYQGAIYLNNKKLCIHKDKVNISSKDFFTDMEKIKKQKKTITEIKESIKLILTKMVIGFSVYSLTKLPNIVLYPLLYKNAIKSLFLRKIKNDMGLSLKEFSKYKGPLSAIGSLGFLYLSLNLVKLGHKFNSLVNHSSSEIRDAAMQEYPFLIVFRRIEVPLSQEALRQRQEAIRQKQEAIRQRN